MTDDLTRARATIKELVEALERLKRAGANEILYEGCGCTRYYVDAELPASAALTKAKKEWP